MLKSIAKILLNPRRASFGPKPRTSPLIILGNGPSLAETIANCPDELAAAPLLAVNFAANAPEFTSLKPDYYVLADPHFFRRKDDPNVSRLLENLRAITWPMTLFIPYGEHADLGNPLLKIEHFPMRATEGPQWFREAAFKARLGMPRPRNVLIPSLMIGLWLGYTEIYICGADHSWMKTLSVNERNEVISIQPHFYKEDSRELERQRIDYLHTPLHSVLESQMIAFRSYHIIEQYARSRSINIYNSTPGSFIDAFRRKPLPTSCNQK